jgi:hypothetical protein|tara:strand:+ start:214 stop:456 length:243 start_codon:yes stop_codon:yes gene_type:complete
MILNYIKRLMGWRTERENYVNITSQIQKQILKRRYAEGKQDKLYGNPPKFSRSVIRHINLTSKGTENVILFKKEKLKKLN